MELLPTHDLMRLATSLHSQLECFSATTFDIGYETNLDGKELKTSDQVLLRLLQVMIFTLSIRRH